MRYNCCKNTSQVYYRSHVTIVNDLHLYLLNFKYNNYMTFKSKILILYTK